MALWLCFFSGFAVAKNMPRHGIFVYSNFCISKMSGDLYGNRITLRRQFDGDSLIYEYTDGSTHIVVADNLVLDEKSDTLSFEVHVQGGSNTIVSGKFIDDGRSLNVRGMLFDEGATFSLKRVVNFGAPLPDCK